MFAFKWITRCIATIFFFIGAYYSFRILVGMWHTGQATGFDVVSFAIWSLTPLAAGLLLLCFSFLKPRLAYASMYVFIWLLGISLWYQQNNSFSTSLTGIFTTPLSLWPWMLLPIVGSLLLAILYKPIIGILTRWMKAPTRATVKDGPFYKEEHEPYMPMQEIRGRDD